MRYLEEKKSNLSILIENQFPFFVQQNNSKFIEFLSSYYESLETKYSPIDIASNLIEYYNIGYFRPNELVKSTKLTGLLYAIDDEIEVESTVGFPETNGYIKIDNEIIFYKEKTDTKFLSCIRGTSALILKNSPTSEIILTNSVSADHYDDSIVENISYDYAIEFFNRIKSEIAPLIPENVVSDFDYTQFLKNIRSFYYAKGSLNSKRILFKILFNDKKTNLILKPRGTGAKLKINNYGGFIPTTPKPEIVSGGVGYDNRVDAITNKLVNSPIITIYGSGFGSIVQTGSKAGTRPNSTAIIEVTSINSSGTITDIEVVDPGDGYIGPIKSKIRHRAFHQNQKVYNESGTGYGKVYYWDGFKNELVLYDVVGFFKPDDELIGVDGESPRAFIARSFVGTTSIKEGIQIFNEDQNIEFPRDYVFKTSESNFIEKKIIKCKFLRGDLNTYDSFPEILNTNGKSTVSKTLVIKQDSDSIFGVPGVDIEVDNIVPIIDDTHEFEVSSNSDLDNLYVSPSTLVAKSVSTSSNFVITVDDASRFPITNGIIFVGGALIEYSDRSSNQFFNCKFFSQNTVVSLNYGDKVISWGRKKYNEQWITGEDISFGEFRYYGDNLYKAVRSGTTSSSSADAPIHTSGVEKEGSFASGVLNPVEWEYIGRNTYRHTPYVLSTTSLLPDTELELFAMVESPVIVDGGSLHTKQQYEFSNLSSPNTQIFNFTTDDISNRLAYTLSNNFNRSYNIVTDSRIPSYQSLTGFNTLYDYENYIYVPSTGIPPWWNEIVDLSGQNQIPDQDFKKINFVNQKLLTRYSKKSLIYDTRVLTDSYSTKKGIGVNVDAIQVNSYKGSTINYGKIKNFVISNGGDYEVPINSSGQFDIVRYPLIDPTNTEILVSNTTNQKYFNISAKFTSINFNKLAENWGDNLKFNSKPIIQIINNNPRKSATVFKTNINTIQDTFTVTYDQSDLVFNTAEIVTYNTAILEVIPTLTHNSTYYIRNISETQNGTQKIVTFSLHISESDAILNKNKISLDYKNLPNFSFSIIGNIINPQNFRDAEFDVSYNEIIGYVDNIVIRDSGEGYIESPTVLLLGGGLDPAGLVVPYRIGNDSIITMRGSIISYTNYYNNNYYLIEDFTPPTTIFDSAPKVSVDSGSGAEVIVYVASGSIASVVVIRGGRNYYTKPDVEIIGVGKDAVIDPIIENGVITSFNIVNPGTGYTDSPRIIIKESGTSASVTCNLKEWTFNLVHRLRQVGRIDSFGGYVYHPGTPGNSNDLADLSPVSEGANPLSTNLLNFTQLNPKEDLSPSVDDRQYLILDTTDKLLSKYIIQQKQSWLNEQYPNTTFNYSTQSEINQVLGLNLHSPVLLVSYDGCPVYGDKGYSVRYDVTSALTELKSRYRLKYSTTATSNSVSYSVNGTTYYVSREDGPPIDKYPIGSFIEDYEYVVGGENDLDQHNGRFCVTEEFPQGRYCYFATRKSYDDVTNSIIEQTGIDFNGFPYFIGNTYASEPDIYPNKKCRSCDKIPKSFTRIFEKELPAFRIPGMMDFGGFPTNNLYPLENTNYEKTVSRSSSLTPGFVETVIIENPGSNYTVGDRLIVDNELTSGSGFSGFVSKVLGKTISGVQFNQFERGLYKVRISTTDPNGLSVGDYVYLGHKNITDPVVVNLPESGLIPLSNKLTEGAGIVVPGTSESIVQFDGKKFYTLFLNKQFKYRLNISNSPYSITYDVDKNNEFFVVGDIGTSESNYIDINADLIPNTLYLHIENSIYEINVVNEYVGEYRVSEIDTSLNSFTINLYEDPSNYELTNMYYEAKSRGTTGEITEITISNPGFGYKKLPSVEIESGTGTGAILQCDSTSIGKIKNIKYFTSGGGFTSNLNVNNYINLPTCAKIINNFEIYEVEVIDGGNEYKDSLTVLVNGKQDLAKLKLNVQIGIITSVEVIDGGSNFDGIPTIEVISSTGTGAILQAKIRRKQLFPGEILTTNVNSILYPTLVESKVLNFDVNSSTLEFDEYLGRFNENNLVYSSDGRKYGNIVRIRRSSAYAKVKPYITLEKFRTDNTGNPSEFLQKITDSNVYQDWSYMISSSRDTVEWRDAAIQNTHPSGNKLFGRKIIERRKFFFDNPEDVFKSSVIFTTNLVNTILLKLKLSPCKEQTISLLNIGDYNVGDHIFGSVSEAIGEVVEKTEYSLKIELKNGKKFKIGEYIVKVPLQFAYGLESATSRSLVFVNGLMQEPDLSYESSFEYIDSFGNIIDPPIVGNLIPKFDIITSDEVLHYKLSKEVQILDSVELNSTDGLYYPSIDNQSIQINSNFLDTTIISVGGSVQNPSSFTLNQVERYIRFDENIGHNSRLFAVRGAYKNQNGDEVSFINRLTFTGNSSGTQFQLNYTPSSNCQLLIFYTGLGQSHLLTDYTVSGNTVTFSETVELDKIFGWYIDTTTICSIVDVNYFNNNRITGTWNCDTKNFTKFIHSSASKTPTSLYELRKEYLDGTLQLDSDGTTVYGYDTKFTYTSPEYSTSYVEVLDKINFDGTTKSFPLTRINGNTYTPVNGKDSLMVYIDNVVLDPSEYEISGSTIVFNKTAAYQPNNNCTIIDFNSSYIANQSVEKGANLDRLDVKHDGIRTTFNLSDRGVPQYVKNVGDIFSIRNGVLQRPDARHQSVSNNKITFNQAPEFRDTTDLVYFNRQLLPLPTKNVVLDDFICFDGIRKDFPLTLDGINYYPQNVYHLFVVRNGVYQKAGIDYRLATSSDLNCPEGLDCYSLDGSHIIFSEAPTGEDEIIVFSSYDGLNQNFAIDSFKYFNGVQTTFALTKNFVSHTPVNADHIQVYRNGVYQYSGVDYTVATSNGGPRIVFTTAPQETEEVYITEFNTSSYFANRTSNFSQLDSTTISYSGSTAILQSDVILIYKDGILISDGWSYDYALNDIIFDEVFTLDNKTRIFVVSNCVGKLDKFFKFDGVTTTFPLTKDVVSKNIVNASDIQVYRNGVYQYPTVDYSVSAVNGGPRITFTSAPLDTDSIFITKFDTNEFSDLTSSFTQTSPTEFQYSGTLGSNYLLIFKDGIVQIDGSYTYNNSTQVLTFSETIDLNTTQLKIYSIGTEVRKLDSVFVDVNGVNDTFSLTYNQQSISSITSEKIQVYRNGVYQYPDIDYIVGSYASGNKNVVFDEAPLQTDDIFITEASNSANFEDITSYFVQDSSNVLGNITTLDPSKTLLIYNQGILQRKESYSYNYSTEKLTFAEPFALNLGVKIYAISNSAGVLDSLYEFDGVTTTFPLTYNNSSISPASEYHIQVHRNGVYQIPLIDYTVATSNGGPRIVFTIAPQLTDEIFVTLVDSPHLTHITPDFAQTNLTTITYSGSIDLQTGLVLIYKNGTLLINDSYTITSSNTVTFSESVDLLSDNVVILHIQNSYANDDVKLINGITQTFALTKNYVSINSTTAQNCLVYRNGVFQYESSDYTISATNGGPRITFNTAPTEDDEIFIHHFNTSTGFDDVTSDFAVLNSTTLQYNSILEDSGLLVFVNGIMQIGSSWAYNTSTQRLIFNEPISGSLKIYQVKNCPVLLNQIVTSEDTFTYQLMNGRNPYYPSSTQSLFVCIDGIVQNPGVAFTVNGSKLVFLDNLVTPGQQIFVIDAKDSNLTRLDRLESAWSVGNRKYFKLLRNYQSYVPTNLYISQNGVIQEKSSYIISNSLVSVYDDSNTNWSDIEIFNGSDSGLKYVDNLESLIADTDNYYEFKLTKNYQTVNLTTSSVVVSVEGVVQNPGNIYSVSNSVIRINNLSINKNLVEIIDVSGAGFRKLDVLSDYIGQTTNSGLVTTKYRLRNTYSQTTDAEGLFISYGSVVQKPNTDYRVYTENSEKIFEITTVSIFDLSQLFILEVSRSSYELLDNLDSFIGYENGYYQIRLTKNYQTFSNLSDSQSLVQIEGVVQQISSYDIIGSSIKTESQNYELIKVYDMSGAELRILDYLSEDFSTPTFKLLQNYSSFTPSTVSDVFVLRDSILQNPSEDYAVGTGYITFTSTIQKTTDVFMKYVNTTLEVIPLTEIPYTVCTDQDTYKLPYTVSESDKNNIIVYLNGVPSFHGVDFVINGDILSFLGGGYVDDGNTLFAIKYSNIDYIDNLENCPDGQIVKFKLLYQGKNIIALSSADILTNRLGVIQEPDSDYVVSTEIINGKSLAKWITFTTPLVDKDTFFVRMYQNTLIPLQSVGGSTTQFTSTQTIFEPENVYVFANGNWMLPTKDYTYLNGVFTLQIPSVDVFAIEFPGIVKVLDDVHTPYDSSRKLFNMFLMQENFVPAGTIENDNNPDETSILVIKNGKVLEPKIDYVLKGDIESQIEFAVAPNEGDVIMVKSVGSMLKLKTITTGFTGTQKVFDLRDIRNNETDYYPNAEIERPREHENQILVIKDGFIQSPLYDYYIDNNKVVFNQNVSSSTQKLVILDFRGTKKDVEVLNRFYQANVGDIIHLDNIQDEERTYQINRKVAEVLSPTVIKTTPNTEPDNVFVGFSASATYQDGKVTSITVTNGGTGYAYPSVLRTKGSGRGAKAVTNIDRYDGGRIVTPSLADIQYPGYNIYVDQVVVPTVYGFVYKNQPLSKSQIRRATTLSQNINTTDETLIIGNSTGLPQNPPSIQITSNTGSGATFRIYVSKNQVRKIDILTQGIGYDEISFDIKLIGGGGSGCVLEPVLDAFGSLTNLIIRNPGEGYDTFKVIVADNDVNSTSDVDAEFIEYTYVDGNTLRGCTRIDGKNHAQGDYVYFDNYL